MQCLKPVIHLVNRVFILQGYNSPDSELKKEVQRKDALIARLIAESNKHDIGY